jgi:hypothetical protein
MQRTPERRRPENQQDNDLTKKKKADVAEHPKVFDHAGLLV